MKKFLSVGVVAMSLLAVPVANAAPETSQQIPDSFMSQKQQLEIQKKIDQINQKYGIGEVFSPEDAQFIQKYGTKASTKGSEISPSLDVKNDKWYFKGMAISNEKNSVLRMEGYAYVDLGVVNHTVSTNFFVKDSREEYHRKLSNSLHFTAYGVVGRDGFVKIADFTLYNECSNANFCQQNKSQDFSGLPVYYTLTPKSTFTDSFAEVDVPYSEMFKF
ncbi:hypothetical protein [Paenibacillus oleatilyticus]|uniref:hypothetical protein n=1 Tax=Paenibacillus oleatilyticus TaxID=2594886 RepID=UPI001C1FDDCE|nr:hypothetical protein [Paenibacillus oleatilyticus]MBU7319303.1 hypothetical protein [Paenibacillus oleatilyticus]